MLVNDKRVNSPILQIQKLSDNNLIYLLYNGTRYTPEDGVIQTNQLISHNFSSKQAWNFGFKKVIKNMQKGMLLNVGVV